MRRWLALVVPAVLTLTGAGAAHTGTAVWTSHGPPPLPGVTALAIDPTTPSTLYVGTEAGVFQSTNGDGSWSAASTGLSGAALFVLALAIDPSTPTTLYAGTDAGVFDIELGCPTLPAMGCAGSTKNLMLLKSGNKPKFHWTLRKGLLALSQSDFGDPVKGGAY
jgi:hypothetical protein